jgi:glycosyltransferase involved in cell wall biosynthesis
MKLGIVTRYVGFNDGQGRVNYELARQAISSGHEVLLFVEQADPRIAQNGALRAVETPPPAWLPSRLMRDQVFALRNVAQVHEPANRCDILLGNGFSTWAECDVNAVHFVHSSWVRSPYHPWRLRQDARTLYQRLYNSVNADLERGAFRRARQVVAVSERVRQDLIGLGVPADRVVTITNGVDTEEFCPGPAQRAEFNLPQDVVIALFAGDLTSGRKNLDTVVRALAQVPALHLAVAGRAEGTPYPALARSLGVADRVHFLGFQRKMAALMRSVDIFAFPSRYDPFPLALLEALASGLPIVTACSVGGSDLIGADAGIVMEDSDDVGACARALTELADNAERRRAMGRQARTLAERHSWPAMADRYLQLFRDIADTRRVAAYA